MTTPIRTQQGDTFQVPAATTVNGAPSRLASEFPETPIRYLLDRARKPFPFDDSSTRWFTLFGPEGVKPGDWLHVEERGENYAVVHRATPQQVADAIDATATAKAVRRALSVQI